MIEHPALEMSVTTADRLDAVGGDAARTLDYARRWAQFHRLPEPRCLITMHQQIPPHAGLGSGTQLGLSVAAALSAWHGLPNQTPQELALSVHRGLRSAVGTYGFVFGGLLVEQGKLPGEPISPLDCRIDLPEAWRFVLARPRSLVGLAGEDEAQAFDSLPEVPSAVTEELIVEARERVDALARGLRLDVAPGRVFVGERGADDRRSRTPGAPSSPAAPPARDRAARRSASGRPASRGRAARGRSSRP